MRMIFGLLLLLLAFPCRAAASPAGDDQNALPEWKSPAMAPHTPAATIEPVSDVPVYIGTTGFAWAAAGAQESRHRWSFVTQAFGMGGFLFSHGPVGNFMLLGGAHPFNPRASFFSGFGVRHSFALRRKR